MLEIIKNTPKSLSKITNAKKAEIIELFVCHNDNSINKIANVANVSKYHTYHTIELYLKNMAAYRDNFKSDRFITLNSKMNSK